MQPFGHSTHGLKNWGLCPSPRALFGVGGSPSNTKLPGQRHTSIPSGILVHPAVCVQRTWVGGCVCRGGESYQQLFTYVVVWLAVFTLICGQLRHPWSHLNLICGDLRSALRWSGVICGVLRWFAVFRQKHRIVSWIGFCLTGPISLCLDSVVYVLHGKCSSSWCLQTHFSLNLRILLQ